MGILNDKKVVIIGASGGIGIACAEECLAEGAMVCGSYRTMNDKLKELENNNGRFKSFHLDLAEKESISTVLKNMIKEFGGIDVLINAAGISMPQRLFAIQPDKWEATINSNLTAVYYTMQAVLIPMISGKGGSIVNISSTAGLRAVEGQCSYSASKAGMIGLSKTAAVELAPKNIRVNVVAPGYTETDMTAQLDDAHRKKFIEQIPMHRFGTAQETAQLCVFLASDKSAYITGQTFVIDGGWTAK
ncbi:MAG: SDR family NAD(P)-dependent oxidoreductase [Ruminococcus sp.]